MLIDAQKVDRGTVLDFDLAIVGSGPAGITIADRLRNGQLSVGLLDGGGFDPELRTQRLYRGENLGDPYYALDACRYRLFGGSSNRWGGWCRPLDPIDFERRDWVPGSGWPIGSAQLEPFYADAAELLDLATSDFALSSWSDRMPPLLPISSEELQHEILQFSSPTNFAERYGPRILSAANITTLIHANVTGIVLDPDGGFVEALRVQTLSGRSITVRARAAVLATGGIENARLLLASCDARPAGLGNEYDLVGRYFMEHIHVACGHIAATGAPIDRAFFGSSRFGGVSVRGLLAPTPAALRRHRLPSCSLALETWSHDIHGTPFTGWSPFLTTAPVRAYRRLRRHQLAAADRFKRRAELLWKHMRVIRNGGADFRAQAQDVDGFVRGRRVSAVYFRAEQLPDPTSRVRLGARCDELGTPLASLDWRIGGSNLTAIESWLSLFDAELRAAGVGRVIMPAEGWKAGVIGGPHHMGTTRMSSSSRTGVVDAQCRVHSVKNLYIAGSSVFTTGGHANPTFTVVALALRLADHLRRELNAR